MRLRGPLIVVVTTQVACQVFLDLSSAPIDAAPAVDDAASNDATLDVDDAEIDDAEIDDAGIDVTDAGRFCDGVDAALCLDFEGPDVLGELASKGVILADAGASVVDGALYVDLTAHPQPFSWAVDSGARMTISADLQLAYAEPDGLHYFAGFLHVFPSEVQMVYQRLETGSVLQCLFRLVDDGPTVCRGWVDGTLALEVDQSEVRLRGPAGASELSMEAAPASNERSFLIGLTFEPAAAPAVVRFDNLVVRLE